jgi:hypothetical protein
MVELHYLAMLHNNLMPQILATATPVHAQWYMQHVAWPHTANVVLDFLH